MTVAQVGEMSAAEFDMWMIRAALEPFTAKRMEVYLAQISMWIHNTNAKKAKPLKDFLLFKNTGEFAPDSVDAKVLDAFGQLALNAKGKT